MIFNDLDKWMFEIENKACPTAKQRRQYVKIERIRDKTYDRYIRQFQADKQRGRLMTNECPSPKDCSARAFRKSIVSGFNKIAEAVSIVGGAYESRTKSRDQ